MFPVSKPKGQQRLLYRETRTIAVITRSENENQMTVHQVFPGIELVFEDYHLFRQTARRRIPPGRVLVIEYCVEGRAEWAFGKDRHYFLTKGDLCIYVHDNNAMPEVSLTVPHFHGITIVVDTRALHTIGPMLQSFKVDLEQIYGILTDNGGFYLARADSAFAHIFAEFYTIPLKIRDTYLRIKVLELLLFISTLDFSEKDDAHPYFRKSDINKIRAVRDYLTEHADQRIPIEELSRQFEISQTLLKSCFKAVYGMPVYTFVRSHRMHMAVSMLLTTSDNIADIALRVGYSNCSKFSAAFKSEMGVTPFEYRKNGRTADPANRSG